MLNVATDDAEAPVVSEEDSEAPDLQRYDPRQHVPPTERITDAADSMEEFNRLLWQLAKSFWIITVMLFGMFLLVIAYYIVEFVVAL